MTGRGLVLVSIVLLHSAACGTDDVSRGGFTAEDSAGVRVAQNFGDFGADPRVVATTPTTKITTIMRDGQEERLYGVTDVAPLAGGGIVVAQAATVSFFDAEGRFESSVGTEGDGPGDFRQIQRVMPFGLDSVGVWDTGNKRLTILSPGGGMVRTVQPYPTYGHLIPVVGMPGDGTIVLTNGLDLASVYGGGSGVQQHPLIALRYSARSGELLDTIAELPGSELVA